MFIIRKKNTWEVYTISDKNDTIPSEGYEIVENEMELKNLDIDDHPTLYKFDGINFIKNQKLVDEKIEKEKDLEKQKEDKKVKIKNLQNKLGLTDEEMSLIING